MKQWKCTILVLQSNFAENILNSISRIQFPYLQRLFLAQNLIESVQSISQISLPALEYLDLSNNKINSFKSFIRTYWPKLSVLHISNNPSSDSQISIIKAYLPSLKVLSCDYYYFHLPVFQNFSAFIKLQSSKLEQIFFESGKRIVQKKVVVAMRRRFPRAQITNQLCISSSDQLDSQVSSEQKFINTSNLSTFEYIKKQLLKQK